MHNIAQTKTGAISAPTNNILVTYGALQVLYCIVDTVMIKAQIS